MNTPSATPPAMRRVRGPPAAIQIGTGRWCGRRAGSRAPTSTARPSSSARIRRVLASSSLTRAGLSPASRTAVSPTPQPSKVRPGASSSIVAIDDAVTVGCRFTGFDRSVARRMRSVTRAAAAISTYVSRRRSCESGWNAASQPSVSARRTSAAKASTERASKRLRPKRGSATISSRRAGRPSPRSPCRGRRRRGRSRRA